MIGKPSWVAEAMMRQRRVTSPRVPPAISRAARWLADRPPQHWPRPLESEVCRLFSLNEAEAVKAIEAARLEHGQAN